MTDNNRKKILITYIDAGAGHITYSRAIHSCIEKIYPGKYHIKEIDYVKELGPASFDKTHKNTWNFFLKHPTAGRLMYFFCEKLQPLMRAIELALAREHINNSIQFISKYKPDIIIAPHPHTIRIAVITNKHLNTKIPVIGIDIEPFEGGAVYDHPEADKIVVFSEIAKNKLIKRGVPGEKLPVFDFIISPKFIKNYDPVETIKKRLGLAPDKFTIVMTSGGEGIGNLGKYIKATIKNDLPVQLVIITGRNARLKKIIENMKLPENCRTNIKTFGFVEDISDFVYLTDIMFSKGGACTTIESLFMNKPIMFYKFVMGNEKESVMFVKNNNLGWYVPTTKDYIEQLKKVLEKPSLLSDIKEKYKNFNFKSGTDDLCKMIVATLEAVPEETEKI